MSCSPKSIQDAWSEILKSAISRKSKHPHQPIRIVSHAVYKRAEEAIAEGASHREIAWILAGASREDARKLAAGEEP